MAKGDETFFPFNTDREAWDFVFRQSEVLEKYKQLGRFTLRVERRGGRDAAYVAILKQVKE